MLEKNIHLYLPKSIPNLWPAAKAKEAYRPILKGRGLVWIGHILLKEKEEDRERPRE